MNTEQKTCKERVSEHLKGRLEDLRKLWALYQDDVEGSDPDLGSFNEYGLAFDYVAPGTFNGQRKGYFRYQLSYGGPSDEFRFYTGPEFEPYRIEYWFLDWFDGARRVLKGSNEDFMREIFEYFKEVEAVRTEYDKAVNE